MITVVIIGFLQPSVPLFLAWTVISRICHSPFAFWRISAQCWLVDEDCYGTGSDGSAGNHAVKMREAMIFSALSMCQSLAVAVFFSLTFLGLGLAGLQTRNCASLCQSGSQLQLVNSCVEDCFRDVIDSQPEALRIYIQAVIGFWAPACELLSAFHTFCFPIKGQRLRELYSAVKEGRDRRAMGSHGEAQDVHGMQADATRAQSYSPGKQTVISTSVKHSEMTDFTSALPEEKWGITKATKATKDKKPSSWAACLCNAFL